MVQSAHGRVIASEPRRIPGLGSSAARAVPLRRTAAVLRMTDPCKHLTEPGWPCLTPSLLVPRIQSGLELWSKTKEGPHWKVVCAGLHFGHLFSKEEPSTSGLLTPRKANRRTALCVSVCRGWTVSGPIKAVVCQQCRDATLVIAVSSGVHRIEGLTGGPHYF